MIDTGQDCVALAEGPGQHCCIVCRNMTPSFPHAKKRLGIAIQPLLSKASVLSQPL